MTALAGPLISLKAVTGSSSRRHELTIFTVLIQVQQRSMEGFTHMLVKNNVSSTGSSSQKGASRMNEESDLIALRIPS
ncbi:hypothetical protein R6Q59_018526 [Mikania micrantha]